MKIKNLFFTLGLTLAVGVGVGVGLKTNDIKEVKAEAAASNVIQYFDASKKADWKDEGAVTKVWVSGSATLGDKGVETTNIDGFLYSFTLPATYSTYTIARLNPADQSWTGNWGQFHDVTYSSDYNYIVSTKYDGKMEN